MTKLDAKHFNDTLSIFWQFCTRFALSNSLTFATARHVFCGTIFGLHIFFLTRNVSIITTCICVGSSVQAVKGPKKYFYLCLDHQNAKQHRLIYLGFHPRVISPPHLPGQLLHHDDSGFYRCWRFHSITC